MLKMILWMPILLVILLLVGFFLWLQRRPPVLVCRIVIQPDGQSIVHFLGDVSPPRLSELILVYGANEPETVRGLFAEVWNDSVDALLEASGTRLLDLTDIARDIRSSVTPGQWAVSGGEAFTARLYQTFRGPVYVTNELPSPGLALNLAWHFGVLLENVAARLAPEERRTLSDHMLRAVVDWGSELHVEPSHSNLQRLTRIANCVLRKS
jgi:hypothetical protein